MKEITAPGKLILAGEYAVLEGFAAIATAVNRRVILKTSNQQHSSALWNCVGKKKVGFFTIDSRDLYRKKSKLGLGSSAASAVCMAAYLDLNNAYQVALAGHKNFSLNLGSGIDVAVSYYGGLIEFQLKQAVRQIVNMSTGEFEFFCVFSGKSQSTRFFLDSVLKFRSRNFKYYIDLLKNIGNLTSTWKKFYVSGLDVVSLRNLVAENNALLMELGRKSGIDIINDKQMCLQKNISRFGGFSKPSGAGGGDISLCFVPRISVNECKLSLKQNNWVILELKYCAPGLLVNSVIRTDKH